MWRCCSLQILVFLISVDASIDLATTNEMIYQEKLSGDTIPTSYHLFLQPFPDDGHFEGAVKVNVVVKRNSEEIVLHVHPDLKIRSFNVTQLMQPEDDMEIMKHPGAELEYSHKPVNVRSSRRDKTKSLFILELSSPLKPGAALEVQFQFAGSLFNDTSVGLFRSSYVDTKTKKTKWFVATHMRPDMARSVFPCYDEPMYKVPIIVSVARHRSMIAISNMPLEFTKPHESMKDWVWDSFQRSPPMPTFSLGLVVSELANVGSNISNHNDIHLRVWAREAVLPEVESIPGQVEKALGVLREFWGCPFPLPKLDIFAVPNYKSARPVDSWGVIILSESDLKALSPWQITSELVYQWLGGLTSPLHWKDALINDDLAIYVTLYTIMKMNESDPSKDWHMSSMYSTYYEYSKRFPSADFQAVIKSEKTESLLRMLNYTLGEKTFIHGMQLFMSERQFNTFVEDDIWKSLTQQARLDKKLPQPITINEIAASWIGQDRLPLVTVTRNYRDNTATLTQGVFLRERPHDVPDQEKFLWWIPVVLVRQNGMNFDDSSPYIWMKNEREIRLDNMPRDDSFIIVNPEEIGLFPVNYDSHNWDLLSKYLCSEKRTNIPVLTRAKLLHDAWNLAYAGKLNFGTALNMTLFVKLEREQFVWERLFTMIDHVGRLIDGSPVYKKFQTYVNILLSSSYEELEKESKVGAGNDGKAIADLRRSLKGWLRDAGYKPLLEEAQKSFKKWIESTDSGKAYPVENQGYLCPVFKWGTVKEWELGLERLIRFPTWKQPEERSYLLKTLAGCPVDANKIERLLNIIILEQNGNFTDNDINLVIDMLTGGADGYKSLFSFLKKNWDTIKIRFEKKPKLWNNLIESAMSLFKTQEGLDMVFELYVERRGQFGTAEFLIEKGLRRIKEETKWSNENYPVLEKWLDQYIKTNDVNIG